MEYYQSASRQYRSQNVWLKRCCLGVGICTAFVLTVSLLSSPSAGVRSSHLVNFNGTETEYTPGVFDRLTGHVRAFPACSRPGVQGVRCHNFKNFVHWQPSTARSQKVCAQLVEIEYFLRFVRSPGIAILLERCRHILHVHLCHLVPCAGQAPVNSAGCSAAFAVLALSLAKPRPWCARSSSEPETRCGAGAASGMT